MDWLRIYRRKIDLIDKKIVNLMLLRIDLAKRIGVYKKKSKINIADKKREMQVMNNIKNHSKKHKKFVISIFKKITDYSKGIQK